MKIALLGYGKMGKTIEAIALERGHEVALKIDISNIETLTKQSLQACDAAIEFSTPTSAVSNMFCCFEAGIPVVCGTTGWYGELEKVRKECRDMNGGLFYASNFSIGVNIFFRINEQLARLMNRYPGYDVSMEEIHHIHKLDAPSGTAITLADGILKHMERKKKWTLTENNADTSTLKITSIREGEIPGTHIIRYQSDIDDIEIKHTAHNRKGFALGAVLAAEFMQGKKGLYGMNDLMKD